MFHFQCIIFAFSVQDMRCPCFGGENAFFPPLVGWGRESSLAEYVGSSESGQAACVLSCVQLSAAWWTVACQIPLSMEFSRQEYWNGLPFPSPGDLCHPRIEPKSPALAGFTTVTQCKVLESGQGMGLIASGFWSQNCFQVWTCFRHILFDVRDITSLLEVSDVFNFEAFQSSLM